MFGSVVSLGCFGCLVYSIDLPLSDKLNGTHH